MARRHGIANPLLLALGLVKESAKGGREPYDAFRGRVIFPIEDMGGRVIAFGGRSCNAEENVPKYLNSPETPVYHKGRTLYGLGWSRGAIRKAETALVVEGYMDYVSLAAHGVENVVAPLGTAHDRGAGGDHRPLLRSASSCSTTATWRGSRPPSAPATSCCAPGWRCWWPPCREGEDPDSLVRGQGAKALQRYLDDAVDVLERKIQILDRRDYFGYIPDTRRAVDALVPTVRAAARRGAARHVPLAHQREHRRAARDARARGRRHPRTTRARGWATAAGRRAAARRRFRGAAPTTWRC